MIENFFLTPLMDFGNFAWTSKKNGHRPIWKNSPKVFHWGENDWSHTNFNIIEDI